MRRVVLVAVAVLVALVAGASTVAASIAVGIEQAFDGAVRADLVVWGDRTGAAMDLETLERIRAIRSVDLATGSITEPALVDGRRVSVEAWDDNEAANLLLSRRATSGTIDALAAGQVMMSRHAAQQLGVRVGDRLAVQLANGDKLECRLIGIYANTHVDDGVIVAWSDAVAGFRDTRPSRALVKVAPGGSIADAQRQVNEVLAGDRGLSARTRDTAAALVDGGSSTARGLLVASIIVAVLGVAGVMYRSALDGVSRGRGPARVQVARESTVTAVSGAAMGAAAGVVLGAVISYVLGSSFTVPWLPLALCVGAAGLVGALATVPATTRAARIGGHSKVDVAEPADTAM
jgi:putative ABC transport system permease protein